MTLKQKTSLFFGVLILSIAAIQYVITWALVMPGFVNIEEKDLKDDVSRVQQTLRQELKHLDNVCLDWASWDDSVDFIENDTKEYIKSNLSDDGFFLNVNIHHIQFVDKTGKTKWVKTWLPNGDEIKLNDIPRGQVDLKHPVFPDLIAKDLSVIEKTGIIYEHGQTLLLATRHILATGDNNTSHGYIIFGRFMDKEVLEKQTQVDFSIKEMRSYNITDKDFNSMNNNSPVRYVKSSSAIIATIAMQDIFGRFPVKLDINYQRSIITEGEKTIHLTALVLVIIGISAIMLILLFINKQVLAPLDKINRKIRKIDMEKDCSVVMDVNRDDEFGFLGKSINTFLNTIRLNTQELENANKELKYLSMHDSLTGIANRRFFDQMLISEWGNHKRLNCSLSIIMCDIDYFKKYNDTYGHQAGDECIVSVADIIKGSLKRTTDILARYGGEEFIILMPDTDLSGARRVADKIRIELEEWNIEHTGSCEYNRLTMSFGVASTSINIKGDYSDLVNQADIALYKSKENGRNMVSVYEDESERQLLIDI